MQTHPPLPEALAVNPTFMLLLCGSHFLDLPGRLHKEWKDGPQAKNVNKLVAVVCALRPDHGVVQHLQGAAPGDLLLPTSKRDSRRRTRFLMRTQLGKKDKYPPVKTEQLKCPHRKKTFMLYLSIYVNRGIWTRKNKFSLWVFFL